ncbi:MAG: creatininase family protein [Phycisphaeraceae bacterium]|nr:creatininase family protein [Phycisphaeraceae bacterium]
MPAIPFGNNQQQLDQVATISFTTSTAIAILNDIARSLRTQGIDRMIILNTHGGNEFKPLVRDASAAFDMTIVVANFFKWYPMFMLQLLKNPAVMLTKWKRV